MDILEMITVGLLTLSGVVVGALLDYWLSERGKRKKSEIQIKEDLLDKLDEWWAAYVGIQANIIQLRAPLNTDGRMFVLASLARAENNLKLAGWAFLKAWHRSSLYIKDISLIKSVNELYKQKTTFEDLYGKTYETIDGYTKLFDLEFNKQLVDQLKALYIKIDEVRNNIIGLLKEGEIRITTQIPQTQES